MNKLRVLITDDEHKVSEALALKLSKLSYPIEVIGFCTNAEEALEKLLRLKPDVLFLDIMMGGRSGLDLLETIRKAQLQVRVILVTAFTQTDYFRKAIQLSVTDYLVKPVIHEELEQALAKVVQEMDTEKSITKSLPAKFTFVCATGKLFLNDHQIVYIKAEGNYSRVYLTDGKHELVTESMKQLEDKLYNSSLYRADRSHFINRSYVQKVVTGSNRCYFMQQLPVNAIELNETGVRNLIKLLAG